MTVPLDWAHFRASRRGMTCAFQCNKLFIGLHKVQLFYQPPMPPKSCWAYSAPREVRSRDSTEPMESLWSFLKGPDKKVAVYIESALLQFGFNRLSLRDC